MKLTMKHAVGCLATAALLSACGGSSSSSSADATPTSVSGTVINGYLAEATPTKVSKTSVSFSPYLSGATICLDKDGDKKCTTADGVSTTTNESGSFTFNATASDLANYPVIAVKDGVVFSAPKAMTTHIISPISTLVQNKIERDGLTKEQATTSLKNDLGLSEAFDLNANYMSRTSAEQKYVANLAGVIALTIQENVQAIATAVPTATQLQVVNRVIEQVRNNLSTAVQQVVQAQQSSTELSVNQAATVATTLAVNTSDTTALQAELQAAAASVIPADMATVMAEGFYDGWMNSENNQIILRYDKNILSSTDSSRLLFNQYTYTVDSSTAWSLSATSPRIILTSTGWKVRNEAYDVINSSTGVVSDPDGYASFKASMTQTDISGMSLLNFMDNTFKYLLPTNVTTALSSAVFPTGSKAYRFTLTYTADYYAIESNWDLGYYNNNNTSFTSVDQMLTMFGQNSSSPMGLTNNWQLKFGTATNNTGTLYLYPQNSTTLAMTSTYTRKTVGGVDMIVADMRTAGEGYRIMALYNGKVCGGEYAPANTPTTSSFMINKTAINKIFTTLSLPTI